MLTPDQLFGILAARPFPGAVDLRMSSGACCFTVEGVAIGYTHNGWLAFGRVIPDEWPIPLDFVSDAEQVHAEIRRVLAIVMGARMPDAAQALAKVTAERDDALTKAADLERRLDGLKSDRHEETLRWADEREALRADLTKITDAHTVVSQRLVGSQKEVAERDATIDELRTALETIAAHVGLVGSDQWAVGEIVVKVGEVAVKAGAVPALEKGVARLTEEMDKATARAEAAEAKVIDLTLRLGETQNRVGDLESELAGARDDADHLHRDLDFMNQRRANAQKRVTDLERQRDEYQAAVEVQRTRANVNHNRADKAEARVKRLLRQRTAAHDVLDEAGIGLEPEGSPRWTLARRCRAAVAPVWGYLDAMQAFDVVGEIVNVTGKTGERGFIDAVIARVKTLRNDDDTRAAIAVAVGLDGSASLALILDTVKSADTTKDTDLARLISYHQAPITFNARPLTLAERASFVIRRLWQGRTNAANEAAALRRELGDIADALGDLPDTAEREPIGDREEHLGLSTAERIRLSR